MYTSYYQDTTTTANMSASHALPISHRVYITNLVGGQALLVDQIQDDELTGELRDAIQRSLAQESLATPSLTPSTTAASTPVSTPSTSRRSSNSSRPFSFIPDDAF